MQGGDDRSLRASVLQAGICALVTRDGQEQVSARAAPRQGAQPQRHQAPAQNQQASGPFREKNE